ncbi:hypothetical protein [Streptomyces sp. st140]|nr:hypothetical protein [Streptomyces sp. st140]
MVLLSNVGGGRIRAARGKSGVVQDGPTVLRSSVAVQPSAA